MLIRDGLTGVTARVNDQGRLKTYAVTESELCHASEDDGDAYSWAAVAADIDTGDTALLVCNNSTSKNLHIRKIYVWCDVAAQFKIHCPAYPTLAGTEVVGVNLNRASGNEADAIAYADETGNAFVATNVIATVRNTRYVRGNGDDIADIAAASQGQWVDFDGALILGLHDIVAVDIIGESAAFECTILGYFHA